MRFLAAFVNVADIEFLDKDSAVIDFDYSYRHDDELSNLELPVQPLRQL